MNTPGFKLSLYWICQIGGWTAFIAYQISLYIFVLGIPDTLLLVLNGIANIILGIVVTHAYRSYMQIMGWLDLPLRKLIPRVILGVISMAIILSAINIPLDKLMFPQLDISYRFSSLYGILSNWSKYILVWALIYHLFQYYRRSLESEKQRYRLEARMKEAEYRQLKAQLNPHFLFNSLNSIRALVDENPQRARNAITHLSTLLRSSLKMGEKQWVSLEEELKTVNDYLSLEKIRFEDRLSFEIHAEPEVLNLNIPPMMLQTLVENGIKHGISKRKTGGVIRIQCARKKQFLYIEISNPGDFDPGKAAVSEGYGISNTRQRLQMLYGDSAIFTIHNSAEHEVVTTIQIPI